MTPNRIAKASAAVILTLAAGFAAADTQSLSITASVKNVCTFSNGAARTMDFGELDPSDAALPNKPGTMSGAVTYKCTKGTTPATLSASDGANFSGSRRMSNGTDFLPYTLSLSAATEGEGFGAGKDQTVTITGSVAGTDYVNISQGAYSDTVTLTVNP